MVDPSTPKFPSPDRTKRTVALEKDADGILDIGWGGGLLSDSRSFRAKMWAQDGVNMLTVIFGSAELKDAHPAKIAVLLERENLVSYRSGAQ